jgi:pilus assembly protein Flp/PilA
MLLQIQAKIQGFIRSEDGATAIEYGLIAAGIAVAISAIVFTVGSDLVGLFSAIGSKVSTATDTATAP